MYCAGCSITPYCSERCQRRDWGDRHRAVCHNLARLEKGESKTRPEPVVSEPVPEPVVPPAAPLRRPNNFKRDPVDEDRPRTTKFIPPGEKAQACEAMAKKKPSPVRTNRNFNNNKQEMRKPQNDNFLGDETWESKAQAAQKASPISKPSKPEQSRGPIPSKDLAEPSRSPIPPKPSKPNPPDTLTNEAELMKIMKQTNKKNIEKSKDVPAKVEPVKMKPDNYLVEKLPIGESFLASVSSSASECGTKQAGFVCVTLHTNFEEIYNELCMEYTTDCDGVTGAISPSPGLLVSYLSSVDGGWYRARCLTDSRAALIDAAKTTEITPKDCKPMLEKYGNYPEFSAVIQAKGIKVGANLLCTIKSKTESGFKVSIVDTEAGTDYGEGEVSRWVTQVEMPTPGPVAAPSPSGSASIPVVPRPALTGGSHVILLDVTSLRRATVRPHNTTQDFDAILNAVLLYGMNASPLKEPPVPGQLVIAKYIDGVHYRALVKRTKAAMSKYLIEYIEYGNEEVVTTLDRLYPCPDLLNLTNMPAIASIVSLSNIEDSPTLTPPATAYVDELKDTEELILTIPSGEKKTPSGSLVHLTLAKNKESVTKKLEDMCTPPWVKLKMSGGDVLQIERIMYGDLKNAELPLDREFTLEITDFSSLKIGTVSGFAKGDPLADLIYGPLTEKMNKYCESESSYTPRVEELCIAKCPPYPQWFRAVYIKPKDGPGSAEGSLLFLDYGNLEDVPVAHMRKMLPEFVDGYPALANTIEIADFPEEPTDAQICLAVEMLNINEEGRGHIEVKKIKREAEAYKIQLPSLVAALKSLK